jgi:hypothetical protein
MNAIPHEHARRAWILGNVSLYQTHALQQAIESFGTRTDAVILQRVKDSSAEYGDATSIQRCVMRCSPLGWCELECRRLEY